MYSLIIMGHISIATFNACYNIIQPYMHIRLKLFGLERAGLLEWLKHIKYKVPVWNLVVFLITGTRCEPKEMAPFIFNQ